MRIDEGKVLSGFFGAREDAASRHIGSPSVIAALLLEHIDDIEYDAIDFEAKLFVVANGMLHYREVLGHEGLPNNDSTMKRCRSTLEKFNNDTLNIYELINFALGSSYIPFVRGTSEEDLYNQLQVSNGFSGYFEGYKTALNYFSLESKFNFIERSLEAEMYLVWKKFASENHLSDMLLMYYLSSEFPFDDLLKMNKFMMQKPGAAGAYEEWQKM